MIFGKRLREQMWRRRTYSRDEPIHVQARFRQRGVTHRHLVFERGGDNPKFRQSRPQLSRFRLMGSPEILVDRRGNSFRLEKKIDDSR